MTIFELIRQEVTAEDAGRLYGLKFDRRGLKAVCPWHADHNPSLSFKDGRCKCFACNNGGDAVGLTAQILGLTPREAAERLRQDFHLDKPVTTRPDPSTTAKRKRQREEREARGKRWGFLCDVVREADDRLKQFTPETITPEFDAILAARCRADTELNILWEEGRNKSGRVGRIHERGR